MGLLSSARERFSRPRPSGNDTNRQIPGAKDPRHASSGSAESSKSVRSVDSPNTVYSQSTNSSPVITESDKFYPVQIGDTFGNGTYVVKGHLGTGRYSSVWLVNNTR